MTHEDEYLEINACACDAYVMNQNMQSAYYHSIPKQNKTKIGRRIVLVFRNGSNRTIVEDSGNFVNV